MNAKDKKPDAGPRLCLEVTLARGGNAVSLLQTALAESDIAAVIVSPTPGDRLDTQTAKPVIDLIQSRSAAALLDSDIELVRTLEADGVHIPWTEDIEDAFKLARHALGSAYIVGAEAGGSRHTAMCLGEGGADYVAFGAREAGDDQPSYRDMCVWWSNLFEVPGMAIGLKDPEEAANLAETGIDFIAVKVDSGMPLADIKTGIARAADALSGLKPVA